MAINLHIMLVHATFEDHEPDSAVTFQFHRPHQIMEWLGAAFGPVS